MTDEPVFVIVVPARTAKASAVPSRTGAGPGVAALAAAPEKTSGSSDSTVAADQPILRTTFVA